MLKQSEAKRRPESSLYEQLRNEYLTILKEVVFILFFKLIVVLICISVLHNLIKWYLVYCKLFSRCWDPLVTATSFLPSNLNFWAET